jgi:hypothetical protein
MITIRKDAEYNFYVAYLNNVAILREGDILVLLQKLTEYKEFFQEQ